MSVDNLDKIFQPESIAVVGASERKGSVRIDYDRHIALVALSESESEESMLGVARVILKRNQKEAEFSVVVGDPWQGKGIGAALLQRCLAVARERGIEQVTGIVLAENIQMLTLGKKLGFDIKRIIDAGEYELSIDFRRI